MTTRAPLDLAISETDWQGCVVSVAALCGWTLRYHTFDARRSNPGFPDLFLVRPPEIIVVELKSERGKVTQAQQEWLDALAACGIETHVWRPSNWDEVQERLRRRPGIEPKERA